MIDQKNDKKNGHEFQIKLEETRISLSIFKNGDTMEIDSQSDVVKWLVDLLFFLPGIHYIKEI